MATQLISQQQFAGGVNEEDAPNALQENQIRKAINAVISKRGSLKKREGCSELGTDAGTAPVFGLRGYTDSTGTVRRLKMVSTNLVEYNAGPWDVVVKSSLTAGLFMQMSDILVPAVASLDTGTATTGADYSLDDSTKTWTVNGYRDYVVKITGGTGSGQMKNILENTAVQLVVDGRWDINPDATSTYSIHAKVKGVVCNNGTDNPFKVIGVTATDLISSAPKFTVQLVVNNRLWGIVGTKIYWSALANGEAYNALDYIDTGETLVSIGKVGDFVAVYSKTKTGVVTGDSPDTFAFIWRDQAHGCIAPQSVANWNTYSIAMAQDGVYVFDGMVTHLCSRPIKPSIDSIKNSDRANSSGFVFENKYYLMHSKDTSSTVKDRIWVMDLIWSNFTLSDPLNDVGVWTVFEGLNVNVMGIFLDSNNLQRLYIGKSDSSKVLQLYDGSFSDNAFPISLTVDTKEVDLSGIGANKKLGWFYYEGNTQLVSSVLQLSRNVNGEGFNVFGSVEHLQSGGTFDVSLFDVATFGGAERIIKRLRPGGRGRTIQFEFYNNIDAQPIEIYKYECLVDLERYH